VYFGGATSGYFLLSYHGYHGCGVVNEEAQEFN
jgi:hypothetical protein